MRASSNAESLITCITVISRPARRIRHHAGMAELMPGQGVGTVSADYMLIYPAMW